MRKLLIALTLALYIACGPEPHEHEAHYVVTAYSVNQWGGRQYLDQWGNATTPVKQADGSYTFFSYFTDREITCPAGTAFVTEKFQQ